RNSPTPENTHQDSNMDYIILNPTLRPMISYYDVNIRDQVRKAYWLKSQCQPRNHTFPLESLDKILTTNEHHYHVEVLYVVIDLQINDLNHRFNEVNTDLLFCMTCLDPSDAFSDFNKKKLCLAKLYSSDFSPIEIMAL
ncbi:hypothetical protein CFOL_v3_18248, partial [Cephalotus follicularis]